MLVPTIFTAYFKVDYRRNELHRRYFDIRKEAEAKKKTEVENSCCPKLRNRTEMSQQQRTTSALTGSSTIDSKTSGFLLQASNNMIRRIQLSSRIRLIAHRFTAWFTSPMASSVCKTYNNFDIDLTGLFGFKDRLISSQELSPQKERKLIDMIRTSFPYVIARRMNHLVIMYGWTRH